MRRTTGPTGEPDLDVEIGLARQAFGGSFGDFVPFLDGKKTLEELRAEGVDVDAAEKVEVTWHADGSVSRMVSMPDRGRALAVLAQLLGMYDDNGTA